LRANPCRFKSSCVKIASALIWSQARWIVFGSGRLEDEDRQEDFGLCL